MSNLSYNSLYNNKIKGILSNTEKAYQTSKIFKKGYRDDITNTNTTISINNNNNLNSNLNNNEKENLRKVINEKSGKELIIKIKTNVKDRLEKNIINKEIEKKKISKKYYFTRGLLLSSNNKDKIKKLDENIEYYKSIIIDAKKNINQAKKDINELNKDYTTPKLKTSSINNIMENKKKLNNIQMKKKYISNEILKKRDEYYKLLDSSAFNIIAESKKSKLKVQIEELEEKLKELKMISNINKGPSKKRLHNLIHKH